jgi:alanine-synthesizing transaminase
MFSPRVPADLAANRLTRAVASARAAGRRLLDLTTTNPTAAGFDYPPDLLRPLANPEARVYRPDARGLRQAREAIAADYARRGDGIRVATEQVVLTSSTSEAYSLLFKLLCAPEGDAVLAPTPSYPLFEHLTRLDGVAMVPYRLEYHGRWMLDEQSVERAWTDRIRAALAVSPNNPTGSFVAAGELEWLDAASRSG